MATRVFTEHVMDTNGDPRFKQGETRDYPASTWERISENTGRPLDSFSKTVEGALSDSAKGVSFSTLSKEDQELIFSEVRRIATGAAQEATEDSEPSNRKGRKKNSR